MLIAPFKVVLDANVLFPFTLRDTLLRAAAAGYFQLYWSEQILDETTRSLVATGTMTLERAHRLREVMTSFFPESLVVGHEGLIAAMSNHPEDRHVAAVAVKVGAQVIVTRNLKDFQSLPEGIEAQAPDDFLGDLFDLDPDGMLELVREQARALRHPPFTLAELVRGLAKIVPDFAQAIAGRTGVDLK